MVQAWFPADAVHLGWENKYKQYGKKTKNKKKKTREQAASGEWEMETSPHRCSRLLGGRSPRARMEAQVQPPI